MIYDFVAFHEVEEELRNNAETHFNDMQVKPDYGKADLDWEGYLEASYVGRCRVVTLRDKGELVAYSVFLIFANPNHKSFIEANNLGIFVKKEYRGRTTIELIRKSDDFLQKIGVMETNYIFNDSRFGKLLERARYKASNTIWSIRYGSFFSTPISGVSQ